MLGWEYTPQSYLIAVVYLQGRNLLPARTSSTPKHRLRTLRSQRNGSSKNRVRTVSSHSHSTNTRLDLHHDHDHANSQTVSRWKRDSNPASSTSSPDHTVTCSHRIVDGLSLRIQQDWMSMITSRNT